ncbi:ST Antigen [California sea lion polyomavirus 2]|nr:ST Antigen [California sea lion polyomavirus 2]
MESVLTKEEKTELLQLLELNPSCYGNVPLMQAKYKRAALKYHPDKGGDEEKMKRLNVLFTKFFSGCAYLREDNPTPTYEVIFKNFDYLLVKDYMGLGSLGKMCANFYFCVYLQMTMQCRCLVCVLDKQHKTKKRLTRKPCLTWGECYCFSCYRNWFGMDLTEDSFFWYKMLIGRMPLYWMHIVGKIKIW